MRRVHLDLGDGAELRRFSMHDAETLFALLDAERERLRRWLPWVDGVRTAEDERVWLKAVLSSADLREEGYGIWDRGELAGCAGMHLDSLNDGADIGYWLGGAFEGRGLVTRACGALIDRGFG
ncbi:MAG TPA: GNAT family N-acetyltransferase, partial [Actinomycetota bacterium]|nr:GNAT family N-acetyltransferase [Actinomycetota bacterium]